jgi:hypothetical protein
VEDALLGRGEDMLRDRSCSVAISILVAVCIFVQARQTLGQTISKDDQAAGMARHPCQTFRSGACRSSEQTEADGRETDAHIAEMKARTEVPEKYERRDVSDILELPSCPNRCSPEVQPNCGTVCLRDVQRTAVLERQAVAVAGELCYIIRDGDGDIHMEIAGPTDDCPMAIDPFRQLVVEVTPFFEAKHPVWAELLGQEQSRWLGRDHHPEAATLSSDPLRRRRANGLLIRVSGLLMRDTHSEGARSGWEIHPITRIECQGIEGRWIEFSRPEDCADWHK